LKGIDPVVCTKCNTHIILEKGYWRCKDDESICRHDFCLDCAERDNTSPLDALDVIQPIPIAATILDIEEANKQSEINYTDEDFEDDKISKSYSIEDKTLSVKSSKMSVIESSIEDKTESIPVI